jgi:protein-disulfide isomerase-like protein with CxxC motif
LLRAKHEQKQDIAKIETLIGVAKSVGLEIPQLEKAIADDKMQRKLAEDHTHAIQAFNIFGTPTIVFDDSEPVYLKITPPPTIEESLSFFEELYSIARNRPYVQEIKRP